MALKRALQSKYKASAHLNGLNYMEVLKEQKDGGSSAIYSDQRHVKLSRAWLDLLSRTQRCSHTVKILFHNFSSNMKVDNICILNSFYLHSFILFFKFPTTMSNLGT